VRAIGVSNFVPDHLERLMKATSVVPAVNQIEVHPYFQQRDVLAANAAHEIVSQAWSPIGGITFYRPGEAGSTLEDPSSSSASRSAPPSSPRSTHSTAAFAAAPTPN
jgi:2,5-diketo-D-gluconate reductase A